MPMRNGDWRMSTTCNAQRPMRVWSFIFWVISWKSKHLTKWSKAWGWAVGTVGTSKLILKVVYANVVTSKSITDVIIIHNGSIRNDKSRFLLQTQLLGQTWKPSNHLFHAYERRMTRKYNWNLWNQFFLNNSLHQSLEHLAFREAL